MELRNDVEFSELVPEVHQQIHCYQEKVNKRFQELEDLIGLAAQKMEILKKRKAQRKMAVKCVNPFAKTMTICNQEEIHESLHHLKLSFPKFIEGSGVAEWIQECEQYFSLFKVRDNKKAAIAGMHLEGTARKWFLVYAGEENSFVWSEFCKQFTARFGDREPELFDNFKQPQNDTTEELKESSDIQKKLEVFRDLADAAGETYTLEPIHDADLETWTRKPIYDEEQGEGQECWPEQDFILAALNGGYLEAPKTLPPEICTSERSEDSDTLSHTQVIKDMNIHNPLLESEEPEHQIPKDLIASTKLDELRLQTAPCFIPRCQDENASKAYKEESKDYDKETGSSHQHSSKEIQVNYKITSDEAKEEVMQLLIGGEQASETLKAKTDVVMGAQIHYLSKSGIVGKFPRGKLPCYEDAIEEESSIILTNIGELVNDVICKESVPHANSSDLVEISSNSGMGNMVIF